MHTGGATWQAPAVHTAEQQSPFTMQAAPVGAHITGVTHMPETHD
jgi:hypothetical protein